MPSSVQPDGIFPLPPCRLGACVNQQGLLDQLVFLPPATPLRRPQTAAVQRFEHALAVWLQDPAFAWPALPVVPHGTAFQQRVWAAIRAIPPGRSRTYGAIAKDLRTTPRAVGQACGANPLPLIVPCHRVVAATGPGGFAHADSGWLIITKRWLLEREGANR